MNYIPLLQRATEKSYQEKVDSLQGKRLLQHLTIEAHSQKYRKFNQDRAKKAELMSDQ
jgi:hypothetical protein